MTAGTASELYDQLRDARDVLDGLHASGRLTLSTDSLNTRWTDVDDAVRAAPLTDRARQSYRSLRNP